MYTKMNDFRARMQQRMFLQALLKYLDYRSFRTDWPMNRSK